MVRAAKGVARVRNADWTQSREWRPNLTGMSSNGSNSDWLETLTFSGACQ